MSRTFAIPDIHGRDDLLKKLLTDVLPNQANYDPAFDGDKLVFMGDMVDRGPDSKGVIKRIRGFQEFYGPERVVVLFGNHERMMIDAVSHPNDQGAMQLWSWNGGKDTLESYGAARLGQHYEVVITPTAELEEDVKWISKLPLSHEQPGFFFSHAPAPRESRRSILRKGQPFNEHELTWTYSPDEFGLARDHGDGIVGVCGHIHRLREGIKEPRFYDHYIFADAGCGCSEEAPLVAINVETREVFYSRPSPPWIDHTIQDALEKANDKYGRTLKNLSDDK